MRLMCSCVLFRRLRRGLLNWKLAWQDRSCSRMKLRIIECHTPLLPQLAAVSCNQEVQRPASPWKIVRQSPLRGIGMARRCSQSHVVGSRLLLSIHLYMFACSSELLRIGLGGLSPLVPLSSHPRTRVKLCRDWRYRGDLVLDTA